MTDTPTTQTTPFALGDVVEITLQGFVERTPGPSDRMLIGFYDAEGNRHAMLLRRKWLTKMEKVHV